MPAEFSNELMTFLSELAEEGERAIVIGGAARVEVALEGLLKSVMHHNPGGADDLFDTDRALGTFSSKIKLAYRMGLLDDEMEKALQIIRRIRNQFAHATTHARLSQPPHTDRVNELARCADTYSVGIPGLRSESLSIFGDPLKASFGVSLTVVTVLLEAAARKNGAIKGHQVARLAMGFGRNLAH